MIEIDLNAAPPAVRAFDYNHTRLAYPAPRNPDFSGMYSDGKDLYVVERSADAICKVEYGGKELVQKETWSYRHIINDPEVGYSYNKYGLGEGLCMDEERIYLVIDNNGDHRASAPQDQRPLLLVMERPVSDD